MIRGVIFDFDGTILDTESVDYGCWCEIYREHGHELEVERWCACIGTDFAGFDPVDYLGEKTGRVLDREALIENHYARYSARMLKLEPPAGLRELLDKLQAAGIELGVASSSSHARVEGHLRRLGLLQYFSIIRGQEDVARVKPAPDLYESVVQAMGFAPDEVVAIEDSPNGARAAKDAGVFCVVIPNAMTEMLEFGTVDLRLQSMSEFDLDRFGVDQGA